jgi:hypothetical protein
MLQCASCKEPTNSRIGGLCEPCYCRAKGIETTCGKCGKLFSKEHRSGSYPDENPYCFYCNFWLEKVAIKDHLIRINGNCYWVGKSDDKSLAGTLGHGGRRFVIRPINPDGSKALIITNNLWHNGVIPSIFRKDLPDNAVFVDLNNLAVEKAREHDMASKKIPPAALRYLTFLNERRGRTSEVAILARAHYFQAVEGLSCSDPIYRIDDRGRAFFARLKEEKA